MTFEDMMDMKRLGETAVSPDGKWLAYSVTTVDLAQNTKTAELWLQAIAGLAESCSMKLAVGQPGDGGPQFAPDGKRILFLSAAARRPAGLAGGLRPGHRRNQQREKADQRLRPRPTTRSGRPMARRSSSPLLCIRTARRSRRPTSAPGNKCNADRDAALAASKVKAQIFTHLLYRHWNHFTGDKRSHLFHRLGRQRRACAI